MMMMRRGRRSVPKFLQDEAGLILLIFSRSSLLLRLDFLFQELDKKFLLFFFDDFDEGRKILKKEGKFLGTNLREEESCSLEGEGKFMSSEWEGQKVWWVSKKEKTS